MSTQLASPAVTPVQLYLQPTSHTEPLATTVTRTQATLYQIWTVRTQRQIRCQDGQDEAKSVRGWSAIAVHTRGSSTAPLREWLGTTRPTASRRKKCWGTRRRGCYRVEGGGWGHLAVAASRPPVAVARERRSRKWVVEEAAGFVP